MNQRRRPTAKELLNHPWILSLSNFKTSNSDSHEDNNLDNTATSLRTSLNDKAA